MFKIFRRALPWVLNSRGSNFQLEMRLRLSSIGLASNLCNSRWICLPFCRKRIYRETEFVGKPKVLNCGLSLPGSSLQTGSSVFHSTARAIQEIPGAEQSRRSMGQSNPGDPLGRAIQEIHCAEQSRRSMGQSNPGDPWGRAIQEIHGAEQSRRSMGQSNPGDPWGRAIQEIHGAEQSRRSMRQSNPGDPWGRHIYKTPFCSLSYELIIKSVLIWRLTIG